MSLGRVRRRTWSRRGLKGRKVKVVSWGFTVQLDGKQIKRFNAEWTEDAARDELAKFVLTKQRPKAKPLTLGEAAERYETAKARKRTLGDDKLTLKRLIAHFGGETRLEKITADVIAHYRDERFKAGSQNRKDDAGKPRPLGAAAVNRDLALLRHLLRLAHEEWGALPAIPRIRLEKEPQGRLRWLTPEEATTLLAKCREVGKAAPATSDRCRAIAANRAALADLVEFCLFTGLRQSEALGLTWDRVDQSRGVILLEVTKSNRRREVPLNSQADAVLMRRGSQGAGYVFGTSSWYAFRPYWEEAVRAAGLVDFHFHDLRHTFASWAMQQGAALSDLKELLGHSSLAMVMRYAHLSPEHLRSAVGRLDGMLHASTSAHENEVTREAIEFQPTVSP